MGLKSCSLSAQTILFHSPSQTTAHSPELIFHTMKSRDQTSVHLSVFLTVVTSVLYYGKEFLYKISIHLRSIKIIQVETAMTPHFLGTLKRPN